MSPAVFIRVAAVLMLGIAAAAAQEPLETRGTWRLVADGPDFALRTQASAAAESTLSLACRKTQQLYAFEIKSPALAARPSGEDIRIGFKVDDDDQVWLNFATGPDGTVPIAHQTAFWIIYGALTRNGAKAVAFTAADQTWRFALDGLRDLTDGLMARCEFEPPRLGPERRRRPHAPPSR
jgi:hypothetical protein